MNYLISQDELGVFNFGTHGSTAAIFNGAGFGIPAISAMLGDVQPGDRVPLHRHDYDELFVVQEGVGTYTIGETSVLATAGQLVLIPAGYPHSIANAGPGILRHTAFHAAPAVAIEWLEPVADAHSTIDD